MGPLKTEFHKVHGLGNDLILIDAMDHPALAARHDWPALARAWCDRHTGIGADSLILITCPHVQGTGAYLRIFNSDGGESGMCGNGMRCVARHMHEVRGFTDQALRLQTCSTTVTVRSILEGGRWVAARVDMGQAVLEPARVPVSLSGERAVAVPLPPEVVSAWRPWGQAALLDWRMTCVSMGNPHAVVFCEDVQAVPLAQAGPALERHPMFPQRTNVQFARAQGQSIVEVRSWERGAGATLACGSGACAAAVAAVLTGRSRHHVRTRLPGGDLDVEYDPQTGHVFMTGGAERVYVGTIDLPD
jgi:diaminopimelate epimerase